MESFVSLSGTDKQPTGHYKTSLSQLYDKQIVFANSPNIRNQIQHFRRLKARSAVPHLGQVYENCELICLVVMSLATTNQVYHIFFTSLSHCLIAV